MILGEHASEGSPNIHIGDNARMDVMCLDESANGLDLIFVKTPEVIIWRILGKCFQTSIYHLRVTGKPDIQEIWFMIFWIGETGYLYQILDLLLLISSFEKDKALCFEKDEADF